MVKYINEKKTLSADLLEISTELRLFRFRRYGENNARVFMLAWCKIARTFSTLLLSWGRGIVLFQFVLGGEGEEKGGRKRKGVG